jgi:hypothetical protein
MEWTYRLLKYNYKWYCQGTEEQETEYVLIHAPKDASFNNVRSVLMNMRYNEYDHIIDIESVEDLTIEW